MHPNNSYQSLTTQVVQVATQLTRLPAGYDKNEVKGFILLQGLDKDSFGWSFPSTLGACFDKYLSVLSGLKFSQKLEFKKSTIQPR